MYHFCSLAFQEPKRSPVFRSVSRHTGPMSPIPETNWMGTHTYKGSVVGVKARIQTLVRKATAESETLWDDKACFSHQLVSPSSRPVLSHRFRTHSRKKDRRNDAVMVLSSFYISSNPSLHLARSRYILKASFGFCSHGSLGIVETLLPPKKLALLSRSPSPMFFFVSRPKL